MSASALASAKELQPLITHLRDSTETQRQIAPDIVDALRAARLCRIGLPTELAGLALPPGEALAVYELLAAAEASVGWIVWNNTLPCFFGRFLAADTRDEVFGDARAMYACSTRPSGRAAVQGESYLVNGRWSLVSGCELAEWLALRNVIFEGGQPRMLQPNVPEARMIWIRRGEVEILDTWHTGGLRGTGSHDIVVKDRLVPRRLTSSPLDGSTLTGTLGRVPIVCNMAAGYAAQLFGLAETAIDALVKLTTNKPAIDPGPSLGERPIVLAAIAAHRTRIAAARRHLQESVARLWAATEENGVTPDHIAEVYGAAHHGMSQGRAAIDAVYSLAGASALYTSSPLERIHRDVHAMAAHVIAQPLWLEDTGRVLLGLKPVNPLYLV
jgi:alkylation response protein AidB-like acyl-CoA dehydrogenase